MRILLSILLLLVFIPEWSGDERRPIVEPDATLRTARVDLVAGKPALTRMGPLTFLGGLHLSSDDPAFGGYSAITVQGDRFTLLSDGGNVMRFRLNHDWQVSGLRFDQLPSGPRSGWEKRDRDTESMTRDPATGVVWIGFENANAIWRYDSGLTRATASIAPWPMRNWDENGGAESMVRRRDGSFVVIAETSRWAGIKGTGVKGWAGLLFEHDPTLTPGRVLRFSYVGPRGYNPTDMAELPDGRLLILNRKVTLPDLFHIKLTLIDGRDLRPGATLTGTEVATFAPPVIHDNFEGLAVTQEGDRTILWIVSDDNQLWLQRSLLLKFELRLPPRP